MRKILQLIHQVNVYRQYPLKIYVNSFYLPHIIGRKRKNIKQIMYASKTGLVKVYSTEYNYKSNELLIIKHPDINICIKAVGLQFTKVRIIQNFQLEKSRENCKIFLPGQKISQFFVLVVFKIIDGTQDLVSKRPVSIQINTINDKKVQKAAGIKNIASSNQKTVKNTNESSAVEL